MKQITAYVREYFHEEWNPKLFVAVGVLLLVCFAVNYRFISEASIIRQLPNPLHQFVFYFFFYGIPYGATLALYLLTTGKRDFLRNRQFVLLTLFCLAILSAYVTLHNFPSYLLRSTPSVFEPIPKAFQGYAVRYTSNLLPGLFAILPIAFYWMKNDRRNFRLYGFSSSHINLKTYFGILLLLVPVVFAASFGSDFQSAYPRYKFGLPQSVIGTERNLLVGVFEICYSVDFVFVELFFRGFMVMAFSRYLGSSAILPMVVAYAFIHFQKPVGEAIGSVFGGLVLGIISYRTKSIYGGIILHLGVAYLMEIAGTMHMLLS